MEISDLVNRIILTLSTVFLLGNAAYSQNDSAELKFNLGIECFYNQDYKCAKSNFEDAIERDSTNSRYYNGLGNAYFKLKDWQRAINHYNMSLLFDCDNVYAIKRMGFAFLELDVKEDVKEDNKKNNKELGYDLLIKAGKRGDKEAQEYVDKHKIEIKRYLSRNATKRSL